MVGAFSRVFVYYPRGSRTGGPEALHQLVHHLRAMGAEAKLVPLPGTENIARVTEYDYYDAPEAAAIEDVVGSAVVVPESALTVIRGVRRAQRIIWWLSIDNATPFLSRQEAVDRKFTRRIGVPHVPWAPTKRVALARRVLAALPISTLLDSSLHLAQSAYARAYIQTHFGIVGTYVTDYLRDKGTDIQSTFERGLSIAFNPKKAPWVPELLGPLLPDVEWNRLENLSRLEVTEMLGSSAVYFDPGYHPGRDRMPREAAINGAVTMVARRGAGAYWEDVPIVDSFKVTFGSNLADDAATKLRIALDQLPISVQAQQEYRNWIRGDEMRFSSEVRRAFIDGHWEDDTPLDPRS